LSGLVAGGMALARSAGRLGTGTGRRGAIVAVVVGLLGTGLAVLHLATATGGIGTGSGRAGAMVALGIALIAIALGGTVMARSRRSG
jgi:hypothetical protein